MKSIYYPNNQAASIAHSTFGNVTFDTISKVPEHILLDEFQSQTLRQSHLKMKAYIPYIL